MDAETVSSALRWSISQFELVAVAVPTDIALAGLYAVTIPVLAYILPSPTSPAARSNLRSSMILYNVIMSVFSAWCAYVTLKTVFATPLKSDDCELFFRNEEFVLAGRLFWYSKYVEFLDTVFLILNKRPVIFLHYFHHIGAPINTALLFWAKSETYWIFIALNGTIHTLMYAYYALSIIPSTKALVAPLRVVMTSMQIVQFIAGLGYFVTYLRVPCFWNSRENIVCFFFTYFYVVCVLGFFLWFFVGSYLKPAKKGDKGAKDL